MIGELFVKAKPEQEDCEPETPEKEKIKAVYYLIEGRRHRVFLEEGEDPQDIVNKLKGDEILEEDNFFIDCSKVSQAYIKEVEE